MNSDHETPAPRQAVALKYDEINAPKVVATGEGDLAEQILALAEECGIHVHEDAALSGFLRQVELGSAIPRELYVAVAQVIAFAYVLKGRFPKGKGPADYEVAPDTP